MFDVSQKPHYLIDCISYTCVSVCVLFIYFDYSYIRVNLLDTLRLTFSNNTEEEIYNNIVISLQGKSHWKIAVMTLAFFYNMSKSQTISPQNTFANNVLCKTGPTALKCYKSGSFYTYLKSSFLGFGFPNVSTFVSLLSTTPKSEVRKKYKPECKFD